MAGEHIVVLLGALAGGFVAGLAGFGTGLTALGIWLHVLSPVTAATLVVVCSVVSQVQTLPAIWRHIEAARVLPFILPGLAGVPLGTVLLTRLDPPRIKLAIGVVVLAFAATMLLRGARAGVTWGGRAADAFVGLAGGVLGGLAGLSGVLPTLWAAVRGWSKDTSRSVFQAFNLSILVAALVAHAAAGLMTAELAWAVAAAVPGTLAGAWIGVRVYHRLSDRRFRELILVLLCASGATLVWSNL